jgi:hypothetical protein
LEGQAFRSIEEVRECLRPTEPEGSGEWLDLSGLILPRRPLDEILAKIEKGEVTELSAIEAFFEQQYQAYYRQEWTWAYEQIESCYGLSLSSVTTGELIALVEKWKEAVSGLDQLLYEDARKEFSLTAMIGFGVDGSGKEKQKDFIGVRGDFENNPFVAAVKDHIIAKEALGNELIDRLHAINAIKKEKRRDK